MDTCGVQESFFTCSNLSQTMWLPWFYSLTPDSVLQLNSPERAVIYYCKWPNDGNLPQKCRRKRARTTTLCGQSTVGCAHERHPKPKLLPQVSQLRPHSGIQDVSLNHAVSALQKPPLPYSVFLKTTPAREPTQAPLLCSL